MIFSASFSKRRATSQNLTLDPPHPRDDVVLTHDTPSSPQVRHHNFTETTESELGRHLGLFSTSMLVVGRVIGTGIFSTPAAITKGVGSVGAALTLWTLGLLVSFAGLMVWIELGCMIPRSGGEKVYLEAAYQRPKLFATTVFAFQAILLGFSGKCRASDPEVGSIQTDTSIQPMGASSLHSTPSSPLAGLPPIGRKEGSLLLSSASSRLCTLSFPNGESAA
jgi:hypothetical protein